MSGTQRMRGDAPSRAAGEPTWGWPWLWATAMSVLIALAPNGARAHLMPAQQGTLNIVGSSVFVVLGVPASAIPGLDADGNGRASSAELAAFGPQWPAIWSAGFELRNGDDAGTLALIQAMPEVEHPGGSPQGSTASAAAAAPGPDAPYFVVITRIDFAAPPDQLTLRTSLFGSGPNERQILLRATRDPQAQVLTLRPDQAAQPVLATTAQTLWRYTAIGIEHILTGPDHVLFVLALVLLGGSWRAWLWLLSTFTVAHSITLVASLRGWLQWPSEWFEPLILLSVAVMGALAARRAWQRRKSSAPTTFAAAPVRPIEVALVFGFGLLHGLGFAESLADVGLDGPQLWPAVLGFNVGVELGQMAIVVTALAMGRFAKVLIWPHAPTAGQSSLLNR